MSQVLLTQQDLSDILEKDIAPRVQDQLEEETFLLSRLPKNKLGGFDNKTKYFTVRTGRNESIASIGESTTTLPTAGRQRRAQGYAGVKYTYGTMEIDERIFEVASGKPGSIIADLTDQSTYLMKDMSKDINRQLHGSGDGVLTQIAASSTQTTITVDNTKYLTPGQLLTINGDAVEVVNITSDTTFTVTTNVTVATDENVVKTNGSDEMNGIYNAVDDGTFTTTFENITTATNHWWKSYVDSTSVTYTTLTGMTSNMRSAKSEVDKYAKPEVIITTYALRDKFMELNEAQKRFVNTTELKGGFGMAPVFDGLPIYADIDCVDGSMYFLDLNFFSIEKLKDLGFRKRGMNGILEPMQNKTTYEAVAMYYANLLCNFRRAGAKLINKA